MKKVCTICGHNGELVWRDGKYYCASCGCEIEVTQQDVNTNAASADVVYVKAACPICKNAVNNTASGGKCHCSLCGSSFVVSGQSADDDYDDTEDSFESSQREARKIKLKQERDSKIVWAVVWLVLFWPVSIYYFWKIFQLSQEIDKL